VGANDLQPGLEVCINVITARDVLEVRGSDIDGRGTATATVRSLMAVTVRTETPTTDLSGVAALVAPRSNIVFGQPVSPAGHPGPAGAGFQIQRYQP